MTPQESEELLYCGGSLKSRELHDGTQILTTSSPPPKPPGLKYSKNYIWNVKQIIWLIAELWINFRYSKFISSDIDVSK